MNEHLDFTEDEIRLLIFLLNSAANTSIELKNDQIYAVQANMTLSLIRDISYKLLAYCERQEIYENDPERPKPVEDLEPIP